MKQGLSLRVSQHLSLTPQLQQAIRLLQLSTLELGQEVEQMLADNPFLEREDPLAVREEFGLPVADAPVSAGDRAVEHASSGDAIAEGDNHTPLDADDGALSWEGDGSSEPADDAEWGSEAPARQAPEDDATDASAHTGSHESLQDHLHRQALALRLAPEDAAALYFLIESLNDDGYLDDSLDTLAQTLSGDAGEDTGEGASTQAAVLHHLTVALGLLQHMEPAGVGARDTGECLRLQLRARQTQAMSEEDAARLTLAMCLCAQPMAWLARRDTKRLAQACGASDARIRAALALIASLEPKPGRPFVRLEHTTLVPDVLVLPVRKSAVGAPQFRVQINPDVLPRIKVHDLYAHALRQHRGGADAASHAALQQRLQEARWFIKNIQQRFDTILRVSTAIVERQKNFFIHGPLAMRPLVLREIADELGLHESTISRVTTAKYMATPQGTFELKYFFGSGLDTDAGGSASSTAVRALIAQFIASENPQKPLSDQQLCDMLKEQGIDCARRTVAKYREGLKIAVASLRRAL